MTSRDEEHPKKRGDQLQQGAGVTEVSRKSGGTAKAGVEYTSRHGTEQLTAPGVHDGIPPVLETKTKGGFLPEVAVVPKVP